jgi:hypothetical protein
MKFILFVIFVGIFPSLIKSNISVFRNPKQSDGNLPMQNFLHISSKGNQSME